MESDKSNASRTAKCYQPHMMATESYSKYKQCVKNIPIYPAGGAVKHFGII